MQNIHEIHEIFGKSLTKNFFGVINEIISEIKDKNFYNNIEMKGIFLFYTPIYYDRSIKYLLIIDESQKNIIDKYPEKFIGELKIKNNELFIDDFLVTVNKYNL